MCCFSQPVRSVSSTRIFARPLGETLQVLAYSMSYEAENALAMVLPLPVAKRTGEKDVHFINLKGYPNFFEDLEKGFPKPVAASSTLGLEDGSMGSRSLIVQSIGDFEASFVPTVEDFSRLDRRFRIPTKTWQQLPTHQASGFAVFRLKPGAKTVHPMAFAFPRANPKELFFPTVHIHDGEVHAVAEFDHVLYCQPGAEAPLDVRGWRESDRHAGSFVDTLRSKELVEPRFHCYRKEMTGNLLNKDTVLQVVA